MAQATTEGDVVTLESAIADVLRDSPRGLTHNDIEAALIRSQQRVSPGVVECLLLLSDQFVSRGELWFRKFVSKGDAVVEALRQYAWEMDRRIFKAEAALRRLPPEQQPTREELVQIVLQSGEFEMLKNDMIMWKG
jgi:hypothetical protein